MERLVQRTARVVVLGILSALYTNGASGQAPQGQKAPPPKAAPSAPAAAAAQQPPQVVMPDAERIVLLLRTTLLTLNDALQTGNFTVLRDISAPGFRDANSAARLSAIFGNLSQRGVDLTAVAIIVPQLAEAPTLDPQTGMLRLKGYFPGQPVRIEFEVLYQAVQGRWRLFGLSVNPATAASAMPPGAPAAPPSPTASPPAKAEPRKN